MIFPLQQCIRQTKDARLWICPNPTADSGMILAVKEDSEYADTVKSLADCDGLKVAVKEGQLLIT